MTHLGWGKDYPDPVDELSASQSQSATLCMWGGDEVSSPLACPPPPLLLLQGIQAAA